ncbi:MAG: poly-gamma-glutamate synthase PgsB, partial [Planctomycetaceae bacterium]|nr:poly-gamma-glutamate synthase PgsB [Planctomycetaceae bacterium]
MLTFVFVGVLLGVVIAWKALESRRHNQNLKQIPLRIHVNGTRGKSSVTRLIVAALQEAGIRTVAKTTGTLPRLILPDGSEQAIDRVSKANVSEQIGVVEAARQHGAEALVIECMALQPHLQWICESKLVKATHGVITNAKADHLDVMGPTEEDVAKALANMTPIGTKLFTAEQKHLGVFAYAARDRGTELYSLVQAEIDEIPEADMQKFSYAEHRANVALVLALCQDLGIDRETATRGMWNVNRDPGALTLHDVAFFGRRIVFSNAFAANDPASTLQAWDTSLQQAGEVETRMALINCRSDRPDRSWQLGEVCSEFAGADYLLLAGTGRHVFTRAATKNGLDP